MVTESLITGGFDTKVGKSSVKGERHPIAFVQDVVQRQTRFLAEVRDVVRLEP